MIKRNFARYRIVRSSKINPWGTVFVRRRLFLKSLHSYFFKIKNMKKKKNYANVLLLDKSRGKIKRRIRRKSFYGKLLMNKQRIKSYYNTLKDKQLRKLIMKHKKFGIKKSLDAIIYNLEFRIDVFLKKCNFVPTVHFARQLISHFNFFFENRCVSNSSVLFKINEVLVLREKPFYYYNLKKTFIRLKSNLKPLPNYLFVDYKSLVALIAYLPTTNDIFYVFGGHFKKLLYFYFNRRSLFFFFHIFFVLNGRSFGVL
jgi:ribosomal protein S4